MKKIRKSIIMMSLAFAMSVVAAGCDNQTSTTEATTSEEATKEATTEAATETTTTTEATTETSTEATTEAEVTSIDLFADTGLPTFELSSNDLQDGAWDPIISSVDDGQNLSPQLSWEPVPEAACYVIYMVDTSAGNWLHWKSNGVTETNLPQGWASEEEYVGPYPPGGTHSYDIYVFALKQPVERAQGAFNTRNSIFYNNAMKLDSVEEGSSGNIISYGYLPGTYTRED